MDRNFLAGRQGGAANTILAAVGSNFSLLLRWFAAPLCAWIEEAGQSRVPGILGDRWRLTVRLFTDDYLDFRDDLPHAQLPRRGQRRIPATQQYPSMIFG
jgi:hypothetical protein